MKNETKGFPENRQPSLVWLSLIFLALAALAGCRTSAPAAKAATAPPGLPVKLSVLETKPVPRVTEYVARLESRESVVVRPRTEGYVTRILVRPGEVVGAGAVLVEVDARREAARLETAQAGVATARADLSQSQATLASNRSEREKKKAEFRLAESEFNRYLALHQAGDISRQELDQRQAALDVARANLKTVDAAIAAQEAGVQRANGTIRQAEATANQYRVELAYFRVTSPFRGKIGDIPVKVGDYVTPQTELLSVTSENPLVINLSVPVGQGAGLATGMPVELFDQSDIRLGRAEITFVSPTADPQTQTILVKAVLTEGDTLLKPDQYARARILWSNRPGLSIPLTAIRRIADESFVFVAEPAETGLIARQRRVRLGAVIGNDVEIIEGLAPGDRYLTTGLMKVGDGTPIVPEN